MPPKDLTTPTLRPASDLNPRTDSPLDLPYRDYGLLTTADYETLGFAEVLRHMRPTLSELGEYDGTALMEFKTRKEIVYRLERRTVCTYEIDDTPPFEIDREAVGAALEISQLFDLNLVNELHVMRKQYLDGSIPTGFQRTAMVGLSGSVPFVEPELGVDRPLRIRQLSLEEDSCREVSDVGHRITFNTDRLGTPLTEIVTEPEMRTPLELQAAARLVARVTRASRKARRGPGAARQDVNVSVAGGRRVEIKGVGHHKGLPRLVHIEAFRQLNLLRLRAELVRRGATAEQLELPGLGAGAEESSLVLDATAGLAGCDWAPLRESLERGEVAAVVRLPGFGGLLGWRTQPGLTFAHELAERVRVIACLTSRPFLAHSDADGLDPGRWRSLREALRAGRDDSLVVLWGPRPDVDTGAKELLLRAREALGGVPAETRQGFPDGRTGFERILPGADRMYPDTDTPPVPVADSWVEVIRAQLPERPWRREERYRREGLDAPRARRLACAPWADLFDELSPSGAPVARRLASALEKRIPCWWRRSRRRSLPEAGRLEPLVRAVERGEIRLEALERALDRLLEEKREGREILEVFQASPGDEKDLEQQLDRVSGRAEALKGQPAAVVLRWAMGEVMPNLLGRLAPQVVQRRLEQLLEPLVQSASPVSGAAR